MGTLSSVPKVSGLEWFHCHNVITISVHAHIHVYILVSAL